MKRSSCLTILFSVILVITGCSGKVPSNNEIIDLIRESSELPKQTRSRIDVPRDSALHKEISALVDEGAIKPHSGFISGMPGNFEANDEYADKIYFIAFNSLRGYWWQFSVYSHVVDVGEIIDKRVDEDNGIATVEYTTVFTPTDYLVHIKSLDPDNEKISIEPVVRTNTAMLRKWDSGWRIVE